jgi:hypothetical protein
VASALAAELGWDDEYRDEQLQQFVDNYAGRTTTVDTKQGRSDAPAKARNQD